MSYNRESRLDLELYIIENLLSDSDYELNPIELDYETSRTDLALKVQKELKQLREKVTSLEKKVDELTPIKYEKREYKYKNEDILCPPTYIPSKEEISLAKARYVIEENIWEIIHYMELYIKSLEGKELKFPYTKESVEKNAKNCIEVWNKSIDSLEDGMNIWDSFIEHDWFKRAYIDTLADMHEGDCTAFPASCMRCQAESIFNIPNSANWKGKSEGYRLYKEYENDIKNKKELEI